MSRRSEGTFEVLGFTAAAVEPAVDVTTAMPLGVATMEKRFTGEVDGTSATWFTGGQAPDGSGTYVAAESFSGTLDTLAGAFVFVHAASTHGSDRHDEFFSIVQGSGTGALAGLRRTAKACGLHLVTYPDVHTNRLPLTLVRLTDDTGRQWIDSADDREVLHNLLGNAVKFTERGDVRLAAAWCDEGLRITVADTGPGIPEADLPHIFDAFTQARRPGTVPGAGVGLGLNIAREITQAMRGRLRCDSRVGEGSLFELVLPLQPLLLLHRL